MAVEVISKRLHHVALPVALIMIGLSGLAAVGQFYLGGLDSASATNISRALTTRVVQVKPTKNGLAEISLTKIEDQSPKGNTQFRAVDQAGSSAEVHLTFSK